VETLSNCCSVATLSSFESTLLLNARAIKVILQFSWQPFGRGWMAKLLNP
jgi:hypothetical protein